MPTSTLRRYTPPTCTLEIAATGSALSRWTDRAVLKNLRFQLSFDDPKLAESQQVTIRGDRTQLEALWEAVSAYIQSFLNLSEQLSFSLPGSESNLTSLMAAPTAQPSGIYLQPRGLLNHDLCLGSLANERSGAIVSLSALQLFDLANVLDEYHAEALTLPALGRSAWLNQSNWVGVAAGLLLTVGATAAVTRFVTSVSAPTQVTAANPPSTELNSEPKSSTRLPVPPGLEPLPSAATLQPLPPIPPAGATKTAAPPVVPQVPQVPTVAPAPSLPSPDAAPQVAVIPQVGLAAPELTPIEPPAGTVDQTSIASAESARSAALSAPADQAPTTASSGTAFDAIPQVAEVRDYFQQTWQPPSGLAQTLEYRLVLNTDGSLQRIVPLGQAAATFLDRTNMPLMNEPFVSPVEGGGSPQIRLVLGQDGKVQTFLERAN